MINYKDLMIGNWVCLTERSQYPMQVVSVGKDYCYLDFEGNKGDVFDGVDKDMMPIEITEELLEKLGFEKNEMYGSNDRWFGVTYDMQLKSCFLEVNKLSNSVGKEWYCHIDNDCHSTIGGFDFNYLHELQNGIRLITGQDLEIKEL